MMLEQAETQQILGSDIDPSELYTALAALPTVIGGRLLRSSSSEASPKSFDIHLEYSIRDQIRLLKQRATQTFQAVPNLIEEGRLKSVLEGPLNLIPSDVDWQGLSPSGTKLVIFRTVVKSDGSGGKRRLLEIWDTINHQLLISQDLTESHQNLIANDTFGLPSWNDTEHQLIYVAETKPTESDSSDPKSKQSPSIDKHRYVPDFGEQLVGIRRPAIFLVDIPQSDLSPLLLKKPKRVFKIINEKVPLSKLVYGQPVFGPRSHSNFVQIFCTGFGTIPDGRRVGLIYCQNRPNAIYELTFNIETNVANQPQDGPQENLLKPSQLKSRLISDSNYSARSPRVVGKRLYYLVNPLGGPHASCATLNYYNTDGQDDSGDQILVDSVDEPNSQNDFPGLYIDQLPTVPSLLDPTKKENLMLVNSIWGSQKVLLIINLETGTVHRHQGPCDGSSTILGTDQNQRILVAHSRTNLTPQIWIGTLIANMEFSWQLVKHLKVTQKNCEIIKLPQNSHGPTEVILTSPSQVKHPQEDSSLVITPHGGPHSTYVNEFAPATAAMVILGFSTAYVNYPGSLGFGQKWVYHLPQHLGTADVDSCKLALDYLLARSPRKYTKLFVNGGSHGGFIIAHLTSRYPDTFDAACMRNPVVDLIGTASGGSDIPDWSFAEANIPFSMTEASTCPPISVDDASFKILRKASPISLITTVKTPTLLLLGDVDKRVSHQQGLAWYHGLKGLGVKTDALMFDQNSHPLNSVEAESVSFKACLEFFSSY